LLWQAQLSQSHSRYYLSVPLSLTRAQARLRLLCNGEAIPAASQFNQLRTLIGPKTPDLRGYFLRGLDATGNVDPDSKTKPRTLLSIEPDAVGPHTHTYSRAFHNVAGKSGADRPDLPGDIDNPQTAPNVSPGETRPKNMAVNFIIKATK
jgi:hypothetical protein